MKLTVQNEHMISVKLKTKRPNLDANTLANVRRDAIKNKRLSEAEMHEIRENVREVINTEREVIEREIREAEEHVDTQEQEEEVDERTVEVEELKVENNPIRMFNDDEKVEIERMRVENLEEPEKVKHTEMVHREQLP